MDHLVFELSHIHLRLCRLCYVILKRTEASSNNSFHIRSVEFFIGTLSSSYFERISFGTIIYGRNLYYCIFYVFIFEYFVYFIQEANEGIYSYIGDRLRKNRDWLMENESDAVKAVIQRNSFFLRVIIFKK